MHYQVDDQVVHIHHGVGRVVGLVNNSFSNDASQLYYEIALGKSTVWVPVQASPSVELRALTCKRDLDQYRTVLRSKPAILSKDHRQRRVDLVEFLKAGTFENLCIVVRDLTAQSQIKTLNEIDSMTLRQAHSNLTREWAAAEDIPLVDAIRQIGSLIMEGRLA
ncbi:MAG TPA: CarD family transcriptional regulator [Anaerolineales bacterium]|nr:CarD family transcriptional regulator [Anaerolineales bacterium]